MLVLRAENSDSGILGLGCLELRFCLRHCLVAIDACFKTGFGQFEGLPVGLDGRIQKLFEGITLADARWLSGLLKRLSDEQIKDAFRAANYSAEEVDQLAGAFKDRIAQLANPTNPLAGEN